MYDAGEQSLRQAGLPRKAETMAKYLFEARYSADGARSTTAPRIVECQNRMPRR